MWDWKRVVHGHVQMMALSSLNDGFAPHLPLCGIHVLSCDPTSFTKAFIFDHVINTPFSKQILLTFLNYTFFSFLFFFLLKHYTYSFAFFSFFSLALLRQVEKSQIKYYQNLISLSHHAMS